MAPVLTATRMLTATADFHHLGFFSFLAVFTAILAVLFGRTIASRMRTLAGLFISHEILSLPFRALRGRFRL